MGRQAKVELQFDMETEAGKIGPVEKARDPKPPSRIALSSLPPAPSLLAFPHASGERLADLRDVVVGAGHAEGEGRVTARGLGRGR